MQVPGVAPRSGVWFVCLSEFRGRPGWKAIESPSGRPPVFACVTLKIRWPLRPRPFHCAPPAPTRSAPDDWLPSPPGGCISRAALTPNGRSHFVVLWSLVVEGIGVARWPDCSGMFTRWFVLRATAAHYFHSVPSIPPYFPSTPSSSSSYSASLPSSFLLTHQQLLYDRETWPHLSLIAVILRPLSLLSPPLFSLLVTRLTYLSPPASALASLYLIPPPYTPPRPPSSSTCTQRWRATSPSVLAHAEACTYPATAHRSTRRCALGCLAQLTPASSPDPGHSVTSSTPDRVDEEPALRLPLPSTRYLQHMNSTPRSNGVSR
jgi:hypothetical protein